MIIINALVIDVLDNYLNPVATVSTLILEVVVHYAPFCSHLTLPATLTENLDLDV